jgi:hypothetical protein
MPTKLAILGPAARNKHGQACVRVQCSCGSPEFVVREDSFKQGRSTSCGFCRKGGRKVSKPAPAPVVEPKATPEIESTFVRGCPEWFADEIARLEAAALSAENRARFLEIQLAQQEHTDLDTHKRWHTERKTAHALRQEIARLSIAKANAETATKKDTRTQAEITRDKIAALSGDK